MRANSKTISTMGMASTSTITGKLTKANTRQETGMDEGLFDGTKEHLGIQATGSLERDAGTGFANIRMGIGTTENGLMTAGMEKESNLKRKRDF